MNGFLIPLLILILMPLTISVYGEKSDISHDDLKKYISNEVMAHFDISSIFNNMYFQYGLIIGALIAFISGGFWAVVTIYSAHKDRDKILEKQNALAQQLNDIKDS